MYSVYTYIYIYIYICTHVEFCRLSRSLQSVDWVADDRRDPASYYGQFS